MEIAGAPGLRAGRGPGSLEYRGRGDAEKAHVVKFSGGRSSAMLLMTLLENDLLDPARGDVVVFNNTAAEHPATYRFTRRCFAAANARGIPCLVTEFQTYEGEYRGAWTRRPAYRLASTQPRWEGHREGLHWRGEVFEELVSWAGFLPNAFRRTCTAELKIRTTRRFLADWLSGKAGPERLGHHASRPRIDPNAMYARHQAHGGAVEKPTYLAKRAYAWRRPHVREAQRFAAFAGTRPGHHAGATEGGGRFGRGGLEYVTLVGLRADEPGRVGKVNARTSVASGGQPGESVYCPLAQIGVGAGEVAAFWARQDFDLELEPDTRRSNCTFCFMKGWGALARAQAATSAEDLRDAELGDLRGTPSDLAWWRRMRDTYERRYDASDGNDWAPGSVIGWFGSGPCRYEAVHEGRIPRGLDVSFQPCECTD